MKNISIVVLMLLLTACGGGGDSSSPPPAEPSNIEINLVGSWTTPCVATQIQGLSIYAKTNFTFTETAFDQTISYFSDSACTNTQALSASAWVGSYGSYTKIKTVTATPGVEATEIELKYRGKGFESAGEVKLRIAAYVHSATLYLGYDSNGTYMINMLYPYDYD